MTALLETVEVEPKTKAAASIVWLHGLGADGHDFESLVPELRLPETLGVRFVFPHARVRPVTINGGHPMRAWYDILALDGSQRQDASGIRESAAEVRDLVTRETKRGVGEDRIVLAGFSQGGAIALYEGLRHPTRLAGILALSTYLPLADTLAAEAHPANAAVPIFMAHGTLDPTVPFAMGEHTKRLLLERARSRYAAPKIDGESSCHRIGTARQQREHITKSRIEQAEKQKDCERLCANRRG
jgi:phospholipase/carboxylesterase